MADRCFREARQALAAVSDETLRQRIEEQIALEEAMLQKWRHIYLAQLGQAVRYEAHVPRATSKPRLDAGPDDPAWEGRGALSRLRGP